MSYNAETDTNSTMNNTYYNISREGSEMAESPVIPLALTQNIPRPQQTSKEPELNRWKSRVPKTGNSPLVPKPLFSSGKCVVDIEEPVAEEGEIPKLSVSTGSGTAAPQATTSPTPISPSPSLFPIPPSTDGIVASPVDVSSPVASLHPSNSVLSRSSVYSQSTNGGNAAAGAAARPRPVSSIYSQNTLTTMTVTAASSPRTPTMTNWTSTLPGLPGSVAPRAADVQTPAQSHAPTHMEQVAEEPPPTQHMQGQILQVPRLRSPSLPQDRGQRRRTISNAGATNTLVPPRGSLSSRPLVQSPERVSYPVLGASVMAPDYEGDGWPLQRPSVVHNVPQKHHVSRAQGSDAPAPGRYSYHVANKDSISSNFSFTNAPAAEVASPRASLAESHTPICGPGEQRSGWWSDDDDVEQQGQQQQQQGKKQGGRGISGYAVVGLREKPTTEAGRRHRARKIKIIAGVSVLVVLIVIGVAVGVTLGRR